MSEQIAGRYELDREVGRGGMGAVWLATDVLLGRQVALKQIGVLPGTEGSDLERVEREARVSAMLHHEHVVSVFDLVHDQGRHWLVMEYVESRTLAELVRAEGPLDPDRAADLVGQAAVALAAAHRAGIVHRDVKPSNILVTPEGRVKLGDFGIARTGTDATLTQTGLVTGSPSYLAPEVAAGAPATEASDLWSLGATVFHAVAGHPPYDARGNLMGALYQIVHDDPPRTERAGWLAPLLEATMHKDPDARWSADRVAAFLRNGPADDGGDTRLLTAAAPVVPPPAPAPTPAPAPAPAAAAAAGNRSSGLALAGVAAVLVVLLLIWLVTRGSGDEPQAEPPGDGSSESADPSPTPSDDSSAPEPEPEPPTEEELVAFVETYLADVVEDPSLTWPRLTPEFKEASGGFDSYAGFWNDIEAYDVREISADPEALTVSYTVEYSVSGEGRRPADDVRLQLVQQDGELLIAGES